MKIEEAISNLEYLIGGDCCDTQMDYVEEIETSIKALRKQIPTKPIIVAFVNDEDALFECRCGTAPQFRYKQHKYCPECGRKLDWGE